MILKTVSGHSVAGDWRDMLTDWIDATQDSVRQSRRNLERGQAMAE